MCLYFNNITLFQLSTSKRGLLGAFFDVEGRLSLTTSQREFTSLKNISAGRFHIKDVSEIQNLLQFSSREIREVFWKSQFSLFQTLSCQEPSLNGWGWNLSWSISALAQCAARHFFGDFYVEWRGQRWILRESRVQCGLPHAHFGLWSEIPMQCSFIQVARESCRFGGGGYCP